MSWQNAPVLNKLTATQLGGKRGAQLWGVNEKGKLYSIYQKTPGGKTWSEWMPTGWIEHYYPEQVYELAASQQGQGGAQLWVLDKDRNLWSTWKNKPDDPWTPWKKNWRDLPGKTKLKKIAATQLAGNRGAQFWGISDDGILLSCYQHLPAGDWSAWQDWPETPSDMKKNPPVLPARWIEVTACMQGDGRGALWALDTNMQLWGAGQVTKGGEWPKTWVGPNWLSAPKLRNIAAVQMGGGLGACIWAIDENYHLLYNYQTKPGTNQWSGWTGGDYEKGEMTCYELTAARQNNDFAMVWAITLEQVLTTCSEWSLHGSPHEWQHFWTPPAWPSK